MGYHGAGMGGGALVVGFLFDRGDNLLRPCLDPSPTTLDGVLGLSGATRSAMDG